MTDSDINATQLAAEFVASPFGYDVKITVAADGASLLVRMLKDGKTRCWVHLESGVFDGKTRAEIFELVRFEVSRCIAREESRSTP